VGLIQTVSKGIGNGECMGWGSIFTDGFCAYFDLSYDKSRRIKNYSKHLGLNEWVLGGAIS
jgi:hypothetical protein